MNSGIYTAYSGLKAQSDALELLSNNLANVNTTAFKEDTAFYTYLNQASEASSQDADLNKTINRSIRLGGIVNLEGGAMSATGRELDGGASDRGAAVELRGAARPGGRSTSAEKPFTERQPHLVARAQSLARNLRMGVDQQLEATLSGARPTRTASEAELTAAYDRWEELEEMAARFTNT